MKITLALTAEEYDLFRAYQREKESLERAARADYERLRKKHEAVCAAVVDALEKDEPVETSLRVAVKNTTAAARAVDLAADWYA